MRIYTRRRLVNAMTLTVSMFTMLFGLFWLVWILITLFLRGAARLDWAMLSQMTPPPGQSGGVLNALVGSLMITLVAVVIGTPVGILAGTYLAEFGRGSKLAEVIRFVNDILLSAPSIILGLFVYETVVLTMGHFSGWAGACALALIVIPVVVRTTENILRLVPDTLREAAAALGTPQWLIVTKVVYRAGRAGILTGVLLAIARISGETAPLLFTSLNNQFWSTDLGHPIASLPIIIFQFAMSPYQDWQQLAWAAALMITLGVLALNIIARTFVSRNEGA